MEVMEISPNAWSGKRVLVTGHTGFKGAWLCHWLHQLGAEVAGLALDPATNPNLFVELRLADLLAHDFRININNLGEVRSAFEVVKPEVVIHLAAQAIVIDGYSDPVGTFSTNVLGTVNILEAMRNTPGICAALMVTSDKCYENELNVRPHLEEDRLGGADPYSASKACAEMVVSSYQNSFLQQANTIMATARAGNVIGGGDWSAHRLIPDCIRSFEKGEPVILRNPDYVRPWQHVLDSLSGYLRLCELVMSTNDNKYCGAWNFAPESASSITVKEVARIAAETWGDGAQIVVERPEKAVKESQFLQLDATKAETQLNWRAHWGGLRGVERAIAWYRDVQAGMDARQACDRQLAEYVELLRS